MFSILATKAVPVSKCLAAGMSTKAAKAALYAIPATEKILSGMTANKKEVTKQKVQEALVKFQKHKSDTGSAAAQIAIATEKILSLTKHFATHHKDKASLRGYQALMNNRRKMLNYLKRKNFEEYASICERLGLKVGN